MHQTVLYKKYNNDVVWKEEGRQVGRVEGTESSKSLVETGVGSIDIMHHLPSLIIT